MTDTRQDPPACRTARRRCWHELADARAGRPSPDARTRGWPFCGRPTHELLDLLAAAYRVRHRWFGNRVHLNFLINAKSGHCGEDCGYCSQSRVSKAEIPKYDLLDPRADPRRRPARRRAAGQDLLHRDLRRAAPGAGARQRSASVVPQIKAAYGLKICVSAGLLTPEQAARLKACGVDRVNHNLNTSERFYPTICTTHTYQDRLDTLAGGPRRRAWRSARGGIVGMGEEDADVVELALRLGRVGGRGRAGQLPAADPRHAAGTPDVRERKGASVPAPAAQPPLLPEGARPVPAGQPAMRAADRRRPRDAPGRCSRWASTRPSRSSSATT